MLCISHSGHKAIIRLAQGSLGGLIGRAEVVLLRSSARHSEVVLVSQLGLTVTADVLHFFVVGRRVAPACAVVLTSGSLGLALSFVGQP